MKASKDSRKSSHSKGSAGQGTKPNGNLDGKGKRACANKGVAKGTAKGRKLYLVDIENFAGESVLTPAGAQNAREAIQRLTHFGSGDLVVVGTSHSANLANAAFAWRNARHLFCSGKNGAEKALAKALGDYRLSTFDEIVLVSGDGFFISLAKKIAAAGTKVRVLAKWDGLNRQLAAAATLVQAA